MTASGDRTAPSAAAGAIAVGLALPLVAFLAVTVLAPVATVLLRSAQSPLVADSLPRTVASVQAWQGSSAPDAVAYAHLGRELVATARTGDLPRLAERLERERPGLGAVVVATAYHVGGRDAPRSPAGWRDAFLAADAAWADAETWAALRRAASGLTADHYRLAFDMRGDGGGPHPGGTLLLRSLAVAAGVAALCIALGFPLAYLVARTSGTVQTLLLAVVLVPFWATVCLRSVTWIAAPTAPPVLAGLFGPDPFDADIAGTVAATTQFLLPFAVLPLYAAMRAVPPRYMRAAATLGATFGYAFRRVYWPHMRAATWAAALLVMALAMGHHATPALAGLARAHAVANDLAAGAPQAIDWGVPTALGSIVVAVILLLGVVYVRGRRAMRPVDPARRSTRCARDRGRFHGPRRLVRQPRDAKG